MKLFSILSKLLYTRRIFIFSLTLLILSLLFYISVSRLTVQADYQYFFKDSLASSYFQNAFIFIKWMTMISVLFLVSHAFVFSSFDGLFVSYHTRHVYILVKLLTLVILNTLIMVSLWLLFSVVAECTIYYEMRKIDYRLLEYIIILGNYYLLLTIFFYAIFKHIVGIFIPFIGFILSFILTDSGVNIYEIGGFTSMIHWIFPDIIFTINEKIQFLYGFSVILPLTIIVLVVIVERLQIVD